MKKTTQLVRIIDYLQSSQLEIAVLWMREPKVTQIFLQYKISRKKFIPTFGVKVIDYFADVLDDKQEIGNCPFMNKFIDYMSHQDITVKEVFLICMAFRRSLFVNLINHELLQVKDVQMIGTLSEVFDQNLAGVIDYFNKLEMIKEKKIQKENDDKESIIKLQTILNLQDNIILKIKDCKIILANKAFLKALNLASLKEFHQKFPKIWNFIQEVDIAKDAFNSYQYDQWLEALLDSGINLAKVKFYNHLKKTDCLYHLKMKIFSKKENSYIMIFDDISAHQNQIDKLAQYVYIDPVTNIYNRWKFDEALDEAITASPESKNSISLLIIEINDLMHINDMYGREIGDQLIRDISSVINAKFGALGIFARIEGSRFALLLQNQSRKSNLTLAKKIQRSSDDVNYINTLHPIYNIAIIHYDDDDTELSLLNRAHLILEDIQKNSQYFIKDDYTLLQEIQEREYHSEQFIQECNALFESNKKLPVVNFFKGIPIQSDATIFSVEKGALTLSIRKIAVAALHINDRIYINMPDGKENIRARVSDIDKDVSSITIDTFKFMKYSPLDRKNIQVQTFNISDSFLKIGNTQIIGKLYSISSDIAVIILPHIYGVSQNVDAILDTTLAWEHNHKHLSIQAEIFEIIQIDREFKVMLKISVPKDINEIIISYVADRQIKIIKELQDSVHKN